MGIEIDISSNITHAMLSLDTMSRSVFYQSVIVALNKAGIAGRTQAVKNLRTRLDVQSRDLKKKVVLRKARQGWGVGFNSLAIVLEFADNPQPLHHFVRRNKGHTNQKGIKVKKRKGVKVQITRGKTFTIKNAFIRTVETKQVFKRAKSGGFKKQSAPSLAEFIQKELMKEAVIQRMKQSFRTNLKNQYEFRMERFRQKQSSAPLEPI